MTLTAGTRLGTLRRDQGPPRRVRAERDAAHALDDGEIRSVGVTVAGNAPELGAPRPGVRVNMNTNSQSISPSGDGKRFIAAIITSNDPGPATLVTNFDRDLP